MTWAAQSQYLQGSLRKLNYLLYYLSKQFSRCHLIRVYKAIYDSKLRYGIVNWGHASETHLQPLRVLQKKAIRSIAGLRVGASTVSTFGKYNILNLNNLFKYSAGCYVHRRRYKYMRVRPRAGLRGGDVVASVPDWQLARSRKQAAFAATIFYNSLPNNIRESRKFGRNLREFLLSL